MKHTTRIALLIAGTLLGPTLVNVAPALSVSIDFEGGSAKVEGIDQQERLVRIVPTPHPDRGWQC